MSNIYEVVSKFCVENRGSIFQSYMETRKWRQDTVDQWELGYFPLDKILDLKVSVKASSLEVSHLEQAYIIKNNGIHGHESVFAGRIIFPVRDEFGKYVAITGRTLALDADGRKYFNTNFEKGNTLYGLNFAINEIRKRNIVYVFEGNADIVTLHQADIKNTVCVMGTAFRDDHLVLLAGYTNNVVLIFDNDTGGKGALGAFNERHIEERRQKGVNIYRCSLKDYAKKQYKDADDFIKGAGRDELLAFIDRSIKDPSTQQRLKAIKRQKKVDK